ncbi:MAG: hypothetical protein OES59_03335 [Gammaproteobacteria bacterium]|nr:hypothetical protein [Gammaproteobacteria bacterium]
MAPELIDKSHGGFRDWLLAAAVLTSPTLALAAEEGVSPEAVAPQAPTHMSEELRTTISKIVILPISGDASESITGTYGKETLGLAGGVAKGSGVGSIPVEVGHVPVNIPIPLLRELGMIVGGITGSAQRQVQELRDRLTEDLSDAVEQPLTNAALATDVFWGLKNVDSVDPKLFAVTTPIPEDTEAILYISIDELTLNVQKKEAIITTSATARLERLSDRATLYRREVNYEDRDTLSNWLEDDSALWHQYRVFARHYIGREISAELYERVAQPAVLAPVATDNIKSVKNNDWQGRTESLTPTLAWQFELPDAAAGAEIFWDIEIYDSSRPVYSAKQVAGLKHTVTVPLEACKTYRWTVRPSYHRAGDRKNGWWMRAASPNSGSNGNVGRAVSEAHAYIQDFASLEIKCRR